LGAAISCFRQQLTLLPVKFSLSTAVEPSHSRANMRFFAEISALPLTADIRFIDALPRSQSR
jgi:hypothetical protein